MRQSKFLLLLCFVIALISLVVILRFRGSLSSPTQSLPKTITQTVPESLAEDDSKPGPISILAPDGKYTLTVKEERGKDITIKTFLISGAGIGGQRKIFSKSLPEGTDILVPYNTFSPDDKYIFLKEVSSSGIVYFALAVSTSSDANNDQTLNFTSQFEEQYPDFKITDVTGWGGPSLIIINTDKIGGGVGPSFWFDIASRSFIRLSNRFN